MESFLAAVTAICNGDVGELSFLVSIYVIDVVVVVGDVRRREGVLVTIRSHGQHLRNE